MPRNMEEYVHRCGRTGRAGKTGEVLSYVCWDDKRNFQELIDILERGKAVSYIILEFLPLKLPL